MKKCPFCHADIEDNARFCLYCMSSLEDKKVIENEQEKNKRWLYIIAAFLLLATALIIILITIPKNKVDNNSSLPILQNDIIFNDGSSYDNAPSGEKGDKNSNSKNEKPDNTTTQQAGGSSDDSDNNDGDDSEEGSSGGSSSPSSSSSPSPSQPSSESEENDSDDSSEQQSSDTTPVKTEAVYIYRDAIAADCYTEGNIPASYTPTQALEDVIVITGVSVAASDGVYVIPEKIGDKKVGAVMPSAFCDGAVAATVKKVVIPSTVKIIWQNAFSSCYNLTDIYLRGKTIDIFETAFADTSKRKGTLTIHCLRDCKNFAFYYYRNIVANYSAQYKEWNGGEIE